MLDVFPQVAERIAKNAVIAEVRNVFGDLLRVYRAPEDCVCIGA